MSWMTALDQLKVILVSLRDESLLYPASLAVHPPLDVVPKKRVLGDLGGVLHDSKWVLGKLSEHEVTLSPLHPLWVSTILDLGSMLGRNLTQDLIEAIVCDHLLSLIK